MRGPYRSEWYVLVFTVPARNQAPYTLGICFRYRYIVLRLSPHPYAPQPCKIWGVAWGEREGRLIKVGGEHIPSSSATPCSTDAATKSNPLRLPPCLSMERVLHLEQKHQFEGPNLIHRAQCLGQRDLQGQVGHPVTPENDNEVGECRGCDGREHLHDGRMTGVHWFEIGRPSPDLQRSEGFESRWRVKLREQ